MKLDEHYWTSRYADNQIQWDAGGVTTPLKDYFDQLEDKSIKVLVPGGGNGHEVEYLFKEGFTNIFLVDISKLPLDNFAKRNPGFPINNLLHADFFEHGGKYDLIVEQTFFSAIDPALRDDYAKKVHSLLKEGGKLVGVLFNEPLFKDHPPFGGNKKEYEGHFIPYFNFKHFDIAYNSIKPRAGRELFICLEKIG